MKSSQADLEEAIKAHASAFKVLKTNLAEAKHERIFDSRIRGKKLELYDAVIGSLTRLAQHLASLRGSIRLQEDLLRAWGEGKVYLDLEKKDVLDALKIRPEEVDEEMMANVRLFQKFRFISGDAMEMLVVSQDHVFFR